MPFGKGKQFGSGWSGPVNAAFGDWQITVIEKATTGFPIFVIASNNASGVNLTNNGNNFNRPDQTCSAKSSHASIDQWFNVDCFANPATGKLGNANRSPAYGPGFVNTDFSAIKNFALGERARLEFRAEMFNLFNHNQLGMPSNDLNSTGFGAITSSVNNPRLVQFALKLNF